jgi:predicted ArsR family transcriptional regulator
MSDTTPSAMPSVPAWDMEVIFHVFADSARRRILLSLATTPLQTATTLSKLIGRKLDATLKHLITLRKGGFVETEENRADGRCLLYRLSPKVPLRTSDAGLHMDFGFLQIQLK